MHFSRQPVYFRVALIVVVIIHFEFYCIPEGRFGDKKEMANTAESGGYLRLGKEREHCSIIRQNNTFFKFVMLQERRRKRQRLNIATAPSVG